MAFEFDADHDDVFFEEGDDVLVLSPGAGFFDEVRTLRPPCPPATICAFFDTTVGGTNDATGAASSDGTFSYYEISFLELAASAYARRDLADVRHAL